MEQAEIEVGSDKVEEYKQDQNSCRINPVAIEIRDNKMKKKIKLILSLIFALMVLTGCENSTSSGLSNNIAMDKSYLLFVDSLLSMTPSDSLNSDVINGLVLMREEEKLARDVYLEFYEMYSIRIFSNIAYSEQKHMMAVKVLLDKYGIPDPVISDETGDFANPILDSLYSVLVNEGTSSLLTAYTVGATIEDLDIHDLLDLSLSVESSDIQFVYDNLTRGSRNHLRSYYSKIISMGGEYNPQFITDDMFQNIINSAKETGGF